MTLKDYASLLPFPLRCIADEVLNDKRFWEAPASSSKHQVYKGGLAEHTFEVVENAYRFACACLPKVNTEVVLTSAIIHDYYKIYEYEFKLDPASSHKTIIVGTEYRDKVRHLAGTFAWFVGKAKEYELNDKLTLEISHCLLAHHGRLEWQAAVEPETIEALILHTADMISARYIPKLFPSSNGENK